MLIAKNCFTFRPRDEQGNLLPSVTVEAGAELPASMSEETIAKARIAGLIEDKPSPPHEHEG